MPTMRSVFSSMVSRIGYDEDAGELHVVFANGRHAVYHDVTATDARQVLGAPSIGSALHDTIKGRYRFSYPEQRHG